MKNKRNKTMKQKLYSFFTSPILPPMLFDFLFFIALIIAIVFLDVLFGHETLILALLTYLMFSVIKIQKAVEENTHDNTVFLRFMADLLALLTKQQKKRV